MSDKIDMDRVLVSGFVNDLKGMSDDEIERERQEVAERVAEDEAWLDALTAEQRIRARS